MEYTEEDNGAAGIIPEFGAIFMSSNVTKKDCFKYKVFALPSSKAEFVKHIKTGMVLFLFEFETRKLFGVYQAASDGAMDIVPHAFNYSGSHFSAQVCFTPIWHCDPLSEKEFQDAIRENYFSAKKFNFGLSEDQVRRLLSLFSSRKLKNKLPPHLLPRNEVGVAGKDRGFVGDDGFALNKRGYMEAINYDEFSPATFSDYRVNSLARTREDEVLLYAGNDAKGKEYHLAQGNFLSERTRMDNDDRLIRNDVEENVFDYGTLETFCHDSPDDSMDDEIRRLDYARRLQRIESIRNEEKLNRTFNHVLSSETSLDVRTADDDRYMHRNRLFVENNIESGSRMAFETESYKKHLEKRKHTIEDERFLFDDHVRREEYNDCDIVKPMAYSHGNLNFHWQAREKLENRYHLDCDGSPVIASEYPSSIASEYPSSIIRHKIRKRTSDGRFLVNDGIETEPKFSASTMDGFSSENCSCQMHCGHMINHDTGYPIGEGRATENAGYNTNFDIVDGGRYRKSERLENKENVRKLTSPVILMEYPSFPKQKQNFSSFSDNLGPEKGLSQLIAAKHNFDDATITRAVPYSPENPIFSHGCSVSMADRNSSFVLENYPHHCSKHRLSPCFLDMKNSSRSLDIAPEYANEVVPTNTLHHQSSLLHEASNSFQKSNLSMHMNLNTSTVNHRVPLFPKVSSTSLASTDRENIEEVRRGLSAYSTKSSENHFVFVGNLRTGSHHASEHVPRKEREMLPAKDFIHSEANFSVGVRQHPEITEAPTHLKANDNRRNVFARLTSRRESLVDEERHANDSNIHERYMDATADEVIEMLQQDGQSKHGESDVNEKQITVMNHSAVEKKRLNDVCLSFPESMHEVPTETRLIDYKRRSDTKKKLVGTGNINIITEDSTEVESSPKMTLKRPRLKRPVFGKIEPTSDTICSSKNIPCVGHILDKDGKQSHEIAVSNCEAEIQNDGNSLSNQAAECNIKELSNPQKQNDVGAHKHSPERAIRNCETELLDKDNSLSNQSAVECDIEKRSNPKKKKNKGAQKQIHARAISNSEVEMPNDDNGLSNQTECNLKEHSNPEKLKKDIGAHVELIGHKTSKVGSCQIILTETTQPKSLGVETSSVEVSSKDADATTVSSSSNLLESSSEVPNRGKNKQKKRRNLKRKKKVES